MSTGKEIRQKIASVKNTQKITKAMEMVSTSKMRRTQQNMLKARPYAENIERIVGHIGSSHPEYRHPFLEQREVKTAGLVIISSDRGLCGGLNANLFRMLLKTVKQLVDEGKKVKFFILGSKAQSFFNSHGGEIVATCHGFNDQPHLSQIIGTIKAISEAYREQSIDELLIASNVFVNTVVQQPTVSQLLPIKKIESTKKHQWDYLYEPDSVEVLDTVLDRYIENLIYKALVENISCEQAARMIAMKNATDNAGKMIDNLNLAYNKARQAAITQELSEIISGAAAV